jgi:hypothetical protein
MPGRRLEDRIRELCAIVLNASDGDTPALFEQLRSALREYHERLQTVAYLVERKPPVQERRGSVPRETTHI